MTLIKLNKYKFFILLTLISNLIYKDMRAASLELIRTPSLGRELTRSEVDAMEPIIYPDGRGLPAGHGSVASGRSIYQSSCSRCHGIEGRGGDGGELAGGDPDLTRDSPDQTIGTYWPYATTLFDFIRRAMPMDAPRTLSDDEVYALCAYLLHLNGLIDATATIDAASLAAVKMPNRTGFIGIDAPVPVWPPPRHP